MQDTPKPEYNGLNYFNALFNESKENCVLLMDENGIILEVNKAFITCFGYDREDICDKHFKVLFTEEDQLKSRPQKEIATTLDQGQMYDNNYLVQKGDVVTWVSGESTLIKDGEGRRYILKIIQNINNQKISEDSIVGLNNLNDSILKSIGDGIIVLTRNMKLIKVNEAFMELFNAGQSSSDSINFTALIEAYENHGDLLHRIAQVFSNKKSFSNVVVDINRNTPEEKILEVSGSLIRDMQDNANALIVIRDITVQKHFERDREDMVGFIGHELRNPVTSVLLWHSLMEDSINAGETNRIKEWLDLSKKNVQRIDKMIAGLYNSTKINAGHLELEKTFFLFAEMIDEAASSIKNMYPEYTITVINNSPDIVAEADRYRLVQVVSNYLTNSIKYADGKKDITITVQAENNIVEVSVKDKGMGIAGTDLPYIFERFFRAEKTINLDGIGLGLFLCKQIIQAHRGNVWAESELGKGSTFWFSIPLQ